ncbi:excalibur calcium-binding domain-containing protein [Rothia halotolerans]|uniref:excalibur calcium-binding domain-containing protein n=1 Tax=Rothia halotolerans TaxID=405770 RepID=UPI00192D5E57|nr:excalibur calcium-binding domain-containing protein [Rothia halotolerans]
MKKTTATVALAAAVGFSALATTPAMAAPFQYQNCTEAKSDGSYNLQAGDYGYGPHLDGNDNDGIGCEDSSVIGNPKNNQVVQQPEVPVAEQPNSIGTAFENCTAAREAGYTDIPSTSPLYGPHLDRDKDGYGCDASGADEIADPQIEGVDGGTGVGAENWDQQWTADDQQVAQLPAGGADTGVAQESSNSTGALTLGGGLLVVVAGVAFMLRRRAQA